VNATACEYLELQLRSSKDKSIATIVAHMIIDPVLKTLFQAINKKDSAMQV